MVPCIIIDQIVVLVKIKLITMSTVVERIISQSLQTFFSKDVYGKDELSKKIIRLIKTTYRELLEERCT